tara:strand:+ start:617 stop:820 length:204 start_codon:yes stop_codon:yes gene_type:complete
MEIICHICSKEFELLKNKSYLGAPLNSKNPESCDPLTTEIIGLCSVCYKVERNKIKDKIKEKSDGKD